MSSTHTQSNRENIEGNRTSAKQTELGPNKSSNLSRKPLQNKSNTQALIGNEKGGFSKVFSAPKTKGNLEVYEDSDKAQSSTSSSISTSSTRRKSLKTCHTQTKLTGNDLTDFQDMVQPDVQFYKELAETRREALNESLKENEELWIEKEEQKETIEEQNQKIAHIEIEKEEQKEIIERQEMKISSLEETVEKARKITEMIEPYLNEETEDEHEPVKDAENTQNRTPVHSEQSERKLINCNNSDEAECLEVNDDQEEDKTATKKKNDDNDDQ